MKLHSCNLNVDVIFQEMEKVWVELNGLLRGSDSTVSSFLTAGSGERPSDSYFEIRKRIGELYRLTCKVKVMLCNLLVFVPGSDSVLLSFS